MSLKIKVLGNASRIGLPPVEARPGYVITLDPSCDDYDWLVVFDELPLDDRGTCRGGCEPLACPPENTILCTWEPVSIKSYSKAYTRQCNSCLSTLPVRRGEMPCPRAVLFTRAGHCAGIRRRRRLKTCCGICGG